eukprot:CAMPEP_0178783500 /NCGR_PEP_ID=MMETSP0745-20121128/3720_1 /TAXON_ID=913974 /ORGANISM="Nitzschia punctata, Strain CCMP561" /LENGTH=68 /DNA_ID=CAMNT_0020441019 /DNA_START=264 /DNA_END=467 /DNA_ORIENTATION=+
MFASAKSVSFLALLAATLPYGSLAVVDPNLKQKNSFMHMIYDAMVSPPANQDNGSSTGTMDYSTSEFL